MNTFKKNMIAAAILLVVCAGIYMNWSYTNADSTKDLTDTLDAQKVMSNDTLRLEGESLSAGAGEDAANTVTDYFAAVRLSRQEARDSALNLLQEAMAYSEGDGKASSAQLDEIVQTALCEAQIESLVIAKGYADCVAYMSDEGISVAVAAPEGGLGEKDVAVIADIVMSQSRYTMNDIRVVEVP